jgi:hypothetical protein
VQERHRVAEPRLEAADRLRRERDLRHQHDDTATTLQRLGARPQVDLGLAGAGDAVQQVRPAGAHGRQRRLLLRGERDLPVGPGVRARRPALRARGDRHQPARLKPPQRPEILPRRAREPLEQRTLLRGQPLSVGLAGPRRPQHGPLPAPRRQHQRQRAGGRGAVLGRHPQRQVHQLLGHAVLPHGARPHQLLDRHLAPLGQVDDHAIQRLPPERHPHHRPDAHRLLRQQVVERPRQLAGGHEWFDAGDHRRSRTIGAGPAASPPSARSGERQRRH